MTRAAFSALILLLMSASAASAAPAATPAQGSQRPAQTLLSHLIGTWDVDYAVYDEHGNVKHYRGAASYRWILDGAAIEETWSDYKPRKPQPYAKIIDFYDSKHGRWTAIWIYPQQSEYFALSGGEMDGRIVLTGHDQEGALQRWSDGDFRDNTFVGRFEASKDGGKTWRLVGVNHMRRLSYRPTW
jgi:hypothetical protein